MTSKTYTYTADELRNKKSSAFLSAYSGGTVKITNVRFPGGHFELKFVRPAQVENDERREQINPPGKQDRLTNAEKEAMIRELISSDNSANEHLQLTFVPGCPGYAIMSNKYEPAPITGSRVFRWFNYKMENGFAATFEECLAKAMAHAVKNEATE